MLDVQTSDKTKLLQDMCNQGTGEMALDPQVTSTELLKREELGSTGVGSGLAISMLEFPASINSASWLA